MFIRTIERDSSLDAFRAEVKAFCERELPAEVRAKQARGQHLERDEYDRWLKQLGARGWITGKWPKQHGGQGWSPEQFLAFSEELGRSAPATERLIAAGALGASAGPSGVVCVAFARCAEPEALSAGLLSAGDVRSKFGDCPAPAVPA